MFVYGGVVYAQKNFTGIDPEKLYRATFICQYGLCCCIVWPSFLFDCFVKIWATYKNFLGKWFTAPPGKKLPVRLCNSQIFLVLFSVNLIGRKQPIFLHIKAIVRVLRKEIAILMYKNKQTKYCPTVLEYGLLHGSSLKA